VGRYHRSACRHLVWLPDPASLAAIAPTSLPSPPRRSAAASTTIPPPVGQLERRRRGAPLPGDPCRAFLPECLSMAVNATGLGLTLPACDPVLGVEFFEVVLVGEPAELRGASSQVDPLRIGLLHPRRLRLQLRHLRWHTVPASAGRQGDPCPAPVGSRQRIADTAGSA
jgi:hypothetical protein